MAAPEKNRNAQKWTETRVLSYLADIDLAATPREEMFLGRVLEKLGLYKDIWAYWKRRFEDNDLIQEKMDLIECRFECNLFASALKGEIDASFAIMILKQVYHWSEYPEKVIELKPTMHMQPAETSPLYPPLSRAA
jgi:hypothetical protein